MTNATFKEPTVEEVKDYMREFLIPFKRKDRNLWNIDLENIADDFLIYYKCKDWKYPSGKEMTSWKAAARRWVLRDQRSNSIIDTLDLQLTEEQKEELQDEKDIVAYFADSNGYCAKRILNGIEHVLFVEEFTDKEKILFITKMLNRKKSIEDLKKEVNISTEEIAEVLEKFTTKIMGKYNFDC